MNIYERVGIGMIALGLGWLLLAGGIYFVREWWQGRRQGFPETRR